MKRSACAAFALLFIGCTTGSTGPDGWRLLPGRVEPSISSIQAVIVPAQVTAGAQFAVTVNTLGSSSCTRADGTRVETRDNVVTITPLDWQAPEGSICTDDLRAFPHTVMVTIARAGEAILRIKGRSHAGAEIRFDVHVRVVD